MQAKLRHVGNSVGVTIPASELRILDAHPGDIVEVQITRVVRQARSGWNDPTRWQGADNEPLHLDGLPDNEFDSDGHWEW